MPETSIVIKAEDRYSSVLKNMSNVTKAFDKDSEHLERTLHELSGEKSILQAETDKARKAMQEAQRQFAKTHSEADGLRASLAGQEYEDYRRKLEAINKTMKETEKQIRSVEGVASGGSGGSSGNRIDTVISTLAASGLSDMLGGIVQEGTNTLISSALGAGTGDALSSALSMSASGAMIGNVIPGIGTAVGAVAGGAIGLASGAIQNFQKENEAFKDYYRTLYEDTNAATAESLSSGSTLATGRETTKLSFNTLLGDDKKAAVFLEQVQNTANTTPFLYDDLVGISKTMLSFGTAVDDIIPTLTKVGDAGAALGLGTSDIGTVATYLGRMQSSNKASLEYLNPLNERGFSVFQWLADDLNSESGILQIDKRLRKDKKGKRKEFQVGDIYDLISKGSLSGAEVSQVILEQFEKLYAGMMDIQSKSTEGLDSTLQGLKENIDSAGGDAYNTRRNEAKEADIASYGGYLGNKLAELSAIGGEVQAYGENLRDQYQREALQAVLTRAIDKENTVFSEDQVADLKNLAVQYHEAEEAYRNGSMEAGQEMVNLKEEAEALATAAYESSQWYQKMEELDNEQIAATRELTAGLEANTNALNKSNELSRGTMATEYGQKSFLKFFGIGRTTEDEKARTGTLKAMDEGAALSSVGGDVGVLEAMGYYNHSHAFGLNYVPWDEYPALLHQGERVLTAAEARTMDRGGGNVSVTVTGNEFVVRQDSDIDEIAAALAQKLRAALLRGGG